MDQNIRLYVFLGVFAVMAIAEFLWPRRPQALKRIKRWPHNIALIVIDNLLVWLLRLLVLPLSLMAFAAFCREKGWGLFSVLDLGYWPTMILSLLALDIIIYGQHVMFHRVPFLWRLHRVHHTDTELDVTSALRFHPLEILISIGIKFGAVAMLGVMPETTIVFEIILNASAMFNHGNINIPQSIDRILRRFIVTPDMHRVHHSVIPTETNSNYGFNIPLWDRIFRTYCAQPAAGHDKMLIGIEIFRAPEDARLDKLLIQPFR